MGSMAETQYTAEVHFAQNLAGNEKKTRDKTIKKLKRWLLAKSASSKGSLTEEDFIKLWKGLHYCMWMQDKPLIQEELANNITSLIHVFKKVEAALMFIKVYFITTAREWNSIDRWRLDKFMMLFRRMLRNAFTLLHNQKWNLNFVKSLSEILKETILDPGNDLVPDGIRLHLADIFVDELASIGHKELTGELISVLLEPFVNFLAYNSNMLIVKKILSNVFHDIIKKRIDDTNAVEITDSDDEEELDDDENSNDEMETDGEKIVVSDEPENKILQYDFELIADKIFQIASAKDCPFQNRKLMYNLVKSFQDLAAGVQTEKQKKVKRGKKAELTSSVINKAVKSLIALHEEKPEKVDKPSKRVKLSNTIDSDDDLSDAEIEDLNVEFMTDIQPVQQKKNKKNKNVQPKSESVTSKKKNRKHKLHVEEDDDDTIKPKRACKSSESLQHLTTTEKCSSENEAHAKKKTLPLTPGSSVEADTKFIAHKNDEIVHVAVKKKSEVHSSSNELSVSKKKKKKKKNKGNKTDSSLQKGSDGLDSKFCPQANDDTVLSSAKASKLTKLKNKKAKNDKKNISLNRSSLEGANISVSNESGVDSRVRLTEVCSEVVSQECINTNMEADKVNKPQKTSKSRPTNVTNFEEDGEIEIYIPSKKYKERLNKSENFHKWQKSLSNASLSSPGRSSSLSLHIEPVKKTPPAFVRRAVAKVTGKKGSKTKTKIQTELKTSSSSKKNVSFDMMKNTSLDFQDSILFSPEPPFQPQKKPNQGILKSPVDTPTGKALKKHRSKKKFSTRKSCVF